MRIAQYHPSLHRLVANHPNTDSSTLEWLRNIGDAELSKISVDQQGAVLPPEEQFPQGMPEFVEYGAPLPFDSPIGEPVSGSVGSEVTTASPSSMPGASLLPVNSSSQPRKPSSWAKTILIIVVSLAILLGAWVAVILIAIAPILTTSIDPHPSHHVPQPTVYPTSESAEDWVDTLCGSSSEMFYDAAVSGSSTIIVVGDTHSNDFDFDDLDVQGEINGIIAVYDSQGERLGLTVFPNLGFSAVATGLDGNVFVVGDTRDNYQRIPLLMKVDSTGEVIWTDTRFTKWDERLLGFTHLAIDKFGRINVVGFLRTNPPDPSYFIAQLDENGSPRWLFPLDKDDSIYEITTTETGSVFAVGTTRSEHDDGRLYPDALAIMLSPEGVLEWRKTYTVMDFTAFEAVTATDEGFIVVGESGPRDDVSRPDVTHALVASIDKSGDLVWSSTFGGSARDILIDVAVIKDQIFAVAFSFSNDGVLSSREASEVRPESASVVQISKEGSLDQVTFYGGSGNDLLSGITSYSTSLIVVGMTSSTDGNLPPSCGSSDAAIIYTTIG